MPPASTPPPPLRSARVASVLLCMAALCRSGRGATVTVREPVFPTVGSDQMFFLYPAVYWRRRKHDNGHLKKGEKPRDEKTTPLTYPTAQKPWLSRA